MTSKPASFTPPVVVPCGVAGAGQALERGDDNSTTAGSASRGTNLARCAPGDGMAARGSERFSTASTAVSFKRPLA